MQKSITAKYKTNLFWYLHLFIFFNQLFSGLIVGGASDDTDDADEEEEPGHQERSKAKVEITNVESLQEVNSAKKCHHQRIG